MKNLNHFLTDLAIDPAKQEDFERNPTRMMEAAGLSEADKVALNSRNRAYVAAAIADDLETSAFLAVMGSCILGDPGPDPAPDPDPLPGDEN